MLSVIQPVEFPASKSDPTAFPSMEKVTYGAIT
jgi:hypothetical protein